MKFIKIETQHTPEQLEMIFSNLSEELQSQLEELYFSFDYVEFCKNNKMNMFVSTSSENLITLTNHFLDLGINFNITDLTKDILNGNLPSIDHTIKNGTLRIIISKFLEQNQTLDNILDKISDKGMENLNNYDLHLLEQINK